MSSLERIVVVGASLAGLRAVETLRADGYDGHLTLVGAEPHLPYDRPPLSKEILRGEWGPERLALRRDEDRSDAYEALEVDLLLGRRAIALSPTSRTVTLDDGAELPYDGLVIATGASVRTLPGVERTIGVFTLRTLDDALAIRAAFEAGARVTVVGAGFIGAEVAASARAVGLDVVVIEPQPVPLAHALGERMGLVLADLHRSEGVDLRCGVGVEGVEGDGRVERVRLSDGSAVDADVVVVGIGVKPETSWLEGSGLALDNGVVCDATLATGSAGVVAAGDVARWHNPLFGETMRVEHWTNAVEQGVAAARRLLAGDTGAEPFAPVPYVWSDQYKAKIQIAGRIRRDDEIHIVHGTPEQGRFVALYGRAGMLSGVVAFKRPRYLFQYSDLIAARASLDDALRVAADAG